MIFITVNKCATTHMEHTTASASTVMNFKVMDSHAEVKRDLSMRIIIIMHCWFVDIDECSTGVDQCEQLCQNTNGSYRCACSNGFRLKRDGLQCEGKVYDTLNCSKIVAHSILNIFIWKINSGKQGLGTSLRLLYYLTL